MNETKERIIELRLKLKLSKYKCAQIIDVTSAAYIQFENADKNVNYIGYDKQQKLLEYLENLDRELREEMEQQNHDAADQADRETLDQEYDFEMKKNEEKLEE